MIPIADESPKRYIPYINYVLIALNIFLFFYQPGTTAELSVFFNRFGLVPARLTDAITLPYGIVTVFTSMFIHGDFMHLAGNMLYLWIFGDNIEYTLGHFRYVVFYLVVGIGAAAAQIIINPESIVPMVGASGAISGVLGAYLVKYPRNRVSLLFFFIFIIKIIRVPAIFVLSFWFLFQLYNGYFAHNYQAGATSVAWFAHIGGFVAGFILIKLFEWYPRYR